MKRQTGKAHGFEHGQTILYAGRNMTPIEQPVRCVITWSGRRIMFRKPDGDTHSLTISEPFWAAPALLSAEELLAHLVSEYVTRSRRNGVTSIERVAVADMLIYAAMITYGLSEEDATERVGDMINDVETGRD